MSKVCQTSIGEKTIRWYLNKKKIHFIPQYRFKECRNVLPLPFDFYLPTYDVCIEYDGIGHFELIFSEYNYNKELAKKALERVRFSDSLKNKFCEDNNISLIRVNRKHGHIGDYLDYKLTEELVKEKVLV